MKQAAVVSHHKRIERKKPLHVVWMDASEGERGIGHHGRPVKPEHREPAGAAKGKEGFAGLVEFDGVGADGNVFGQLVGHLGVAIRRQAVRAVSVWRTDGISRCRSDVFFRVIELHCCPDPAD